MRPRDAERVEHAQGVRGHVGKRVGRAHRQPHEVAQGRDRDVGDAQLVEAVAQAGVAVVEADDAQAARQQPLDELLGPARELHAQAHHEQDRRRVARTGVLDLERQAVGGHAHRAARRMRQPGAVIRAPRPT